MQILLQGIAEKAAKEKTYRFRDLSRMLRAENLIWSFGKMNKRAAAGVDNVDYNEYASNLEANVEDLVMRLKSEKYKATLIRRKYIPKGRGQRRPLGIPVVEDRMLQAAVAHILQAIHEQNFLDCSHGYRSGRSAKGCAKALRTKLQCGRYHHVVEADIKGFFDAIDHEILIEMLKQRIDDKRFIRLIRRWLKAGIFEEDGQITNPVTGTPQGGGVSAVLANIYLHYALDVWFDEEVKKQAKGNVTMVRYADDCVAAFESKAEAEAFKESVKDRLKKFGLELNEAKTNVLMFSRGGKGGNKRFDFLGFEYRWTLSRRGNKVIKLRTSRKKLRTAIANFSEWIRKERHQGLKRLIPTLKRKLYGYWNYFGVICNSKSLEQFYYQVQKLLFKWLNRRSQKRSMNWKCFKEFIRTCLYKARPRITERLA